VTVEEALTIVDRALKEAHLTNLQALVFQQCWQGRTYAEIADSAGYDPDYIRDVGSKLWQLLSKALGERVTKHNVQSVLRRCAQQPETPSLTSHLFPEQTGLKSQLQAAPEVATWSAIPGGSGKLGKAGYETDETRWVGRDQLIQELAQKLLQDCRILSLVGLTGIGKSSLAARLILEPAIAQAFPVLKVISFDAEPPNFAVVARRLLGEQVTQDERLQKDPSLLVSEMVAALKLQPCLLILDMAEEILEVSDRGGHQFKDPAFAQFLDQVVRSETMPARILITSQDQPPVFAEGRYPERSHLQILKGLNELEALELFELWDIQGTEALDQLYLQRIAQVYEGHPLALKVIAGEMRGYPYDGDVQAYWQDYGAEIEAVERLRDSAEPLSAASQSYLDCYSPNLADLVRRRVEKTFERLYAASPLACLLLCMGATYRRPVERTAWLFLIGDYPPDEQRLAFHTLQRRFLLEAESRDRRVCYRLHNLIRRVALENLPRLAAEVQSL